MRTAELIQACHDLLSTNAGLVSQLSQAYGVAPVFQVGRVPRKDGGDPLAFPYVTVSVPNDGDFSTKGTLGGSAIVQIDVWDRSGSAISMAGLMRMASLAVVRQPWDVPGFITCERENSDVIADPDGKTMHGLIRVRVMYLD